jgi:enoyl-CoA hydratase/carnithine racemase
VLLRRLIGDGWARELMLFGTELDADAALRTGLVTRVVPEADLEALALGMARRAGEQSADAIRATKRLLNADPRRWQQTLDAEAEAVVDGFGSETTQARLESFVARRRDRT